MRRRIKSLCGRYFSSSIDNSVSASLKTRRKKKTSHKSKSLFVPINEKRSWRSNSTPTVVDWFQDDMRLRVEINENIRKCKSAVKIFRMDGTIVHALAALDDLIDIDPSRRKINMYAKSQWLSRLQRYQEALDSLPIKETLRDVDKRNSPLTKSLSLREKVVVFEWQLKSALVNSETRNHNTRLGWMWKQWIVDQNVLC